MVALAQSPSQLNLTLPLALEILAERGFGGQTRPELQKRFERHPDLAISLAEQEIRKAALEQINTAFPMP